MPILFPRLIYAPAITFTSCPVNKLNAYAPAYTFVHGAGARDMSNVQGFQLLVSGMNVYAETHIQLTVSVSDFWALKMGHGTWKGSIHRLWGTPNNFLK